MRTSNRKKKLTATITFNEKIAKRYHDTRYYEAIITLDHIFKKKLTAASKNQPPPIHDDLMSIISHPDVLKMAYRTIRKDKGA